MTQSDGILDWRWTIRGVDSSCVDWNFYTFLEVAYYNDVVGEVYSLKRQVGDFLEAIRWHWKIRVHRSLTFFFIFDIILILDCIWVAEFSNI